MSLRGLGGYGTHDPSTNSDYGSTDGRVISLEKSVYQFRGRTLYKARLPITSPTLLTTTATAVYPCQRGDHTLLHEIAPEANCTLTSTSILPVLGVEHNSTYWFPDITIQAGYSHGLAVQGRVLASYREEDMLLWRTFTLPTVPATEASLVIGLSEGGVPQVTLISHRETFDLQGWKGPYTHDQAQLLALGRLHCLLDRASSPYLSPRITQFVLTTNPSFMMHHLDRWRVRRLTLDCQLRLIWPPRPVRTHVRGTSQHLVYLGSGRHIHKYTEIIDGSFMGSIMLLGARVDLREQAFEVGGALDEGLTARMREVLGGAAAHLIYVEDLPLGLIKRWFSCPTWGGSIEVSRFAARRTVSSIIIKSIYFLTGLPSYSVGELNREMLRIAVGGTYVRLTPSVYSEVPRRSPPEIEQTAIFGFRAHRCRGYGIVEVKTKKELSQGGVLRHSNDICIVANSDLSSREALVAKFLRAALLSRAPLRTEDLYFLLEWPRTLAPQEIWPTKRCRTFDESHLRIINQLFNEQAPPRVRQSMVFSGSREVRKFLSGYYPERSRFAPNLYSMNEPLTSSAICFDPAMTNDHEIAVRPQGPGLEFFVPIANRTTGARKSIAGSLREGELVFVISLRSTGRFLTNLRVCPPLCFFDPSLVDTSCRWVPTEVLDTTAMLKDILTSGALGTLLREIWCEPFLVQTPVTCQQLVRLISFTLSLVLSSKALALNLPTLGWGVRFPGRYLLPFDSSSSLLVREQNKKNITGSHKGGPFAWTAGGFINHPFGRFHGRLRNEDAATNFEVLYSQSPIFYDGDLSVPISAEESTLTWTKVAYGTPIRTFDHEIQALRCSCQFPLQHVCPDLAEEDVNSILSETARISRVCAGTEKGILAACYLLLQDAPEQLEVQYCTDLAVNISFWINGLPVYTSDMESLCKEEARKLIFSFLSSIIKI